MTLDPLDNLPVLRDLIVDDAHYHDCLVGLRLFLERTKKAKSQPEKIGRGDLDRFKIVSRCVTCHICISVCPAYKANRHAFLGPAGFVQLARHAFDPRDELNREIVAHSAGIDRCILCGKCEEVCPHGISPKETIELLRAKLEQNQESISKPLMDNQTRKESMS
jgi:succinate dehydrogenase/fumarate reductase iron-sulfur protein